MDLHPAVSSPREEWILWRQGALHAQFGKMYLPQENLVTGVECLRGLALPGKISLADFRL